ncbi:cation:proton antiporter [Geomicrobium sp. JSM 1781026]|uniref:cation:proton antiporter n=1 Tax=Geomicrobium sp. JSM 1781026 TaxID=3344580 RepID=UPI0035C25419
MHVFISILMLLILVVVGTILHRQFSKIPAALFQVFLGTVLGVLLPGLTFEFEPELFLMAVIGPILFFDGYHASRTAFWTYRWPILLMAFGLVFITVAGLGFIIHMLIPEMALGVAFALAAVLSPTDAVAVRSITKGMKLPKGLMTILEGESLINDAAGIVSFKIALAATITGVFSIWEGSSNFVFVALGGALVGFLGALIIVQIRIMLRTFGFEDVYSLVSIQLFTPFVIYFLAEAVHVSGILAVVTASVVYGIERDKLQQTSMQMQVVANNTWSIVGYLLNGFVFVLLGFLLPEVWQGLTASEEYPLGWITLLTVCIAIALFIIRYVWVYVWHPLFSGSPTQSLLFIEERQQSKGNDSSEFSRSYYALFAAVCGIHGTITLATALLIPDQLNDGTAFPLRDTVLFIAAGVVLISMIAATIFLPMMGKREKGNKQRSWSVNEAHAHMIEAIVTSLEKKVTTTDMLLYHTVIARFKKQLIYVERGVELGHSRQEINRLRDLVKDIERTTLKVLIDERTVEKRTAQIYSAYRSKVDSYIRMSVLKRYWFNVKLGLLKSRQFTRGHVGATHEIRQLKKIEDVIHPNVMNRLTNEETSHNRREVMYVKEEQHQHLHVLYAPPEQGEEDVKEIKRIHLAGIQQGRVFIDEQIQAGHLAIREAHELRERLLYNEMVVLREGEELEDE